MTSIEPTIQVNQSIQSLCIIDVLWPNFLYKLHHGMGVAYQA